MIQVEIRNFQSIEKLDFKIEGFTALVGKSNIGKSAIIRALKCALSGADGTGFVRHDAATCSRILKNTKKCKCAASVVLKFEDGRTLIWEKGDSVNQYQAINQEGQKSVYDKIGSSPDLPDLLRDEFSPVTIGRDKKCIQISDQFYPIFLLDMPGPTVAEVLSDVAQLDGINKAMKLVSKDRKAAVATRKVRESDIVELERDLSAYEGLDIVVSQVHQKQDGYSQILLKNGDLLQLNEFLENFLNIGRTVKRLIGVSSVGVPSADPVRTKAKHLSKAVELWTALDSKVQVIRSLQGVQQVTLPPALPTQNVRVLEQLGTWQKRLQVLDRHVQASESLEAVKVPDVGGLQAKAAALGQLRAWEVKNTTLVVSYRASQKLSDLPSLDADPLKATSKRLEVVASYYRNLERLTSEVSETEKALNQALEEAKAVQSEFAALGVCPTCSQMISPEHVVCGD